jgi:anti-sigma B factor antagonist
VTVQHQPRGPAVVVRLAGDVDLHSAEILHDALTTALTNATPPHPVVLDLTAIGFFGSIGLAQLLQTQHHAHHRHIPLRIVATHRAVLRPSTSPTSRPHSTSARTSPPP